MINSYFTKFCGITSQHDALNAQALGCNALGFVFVKKSKRYIDVTSCQNIIKTLSPTMLTVALFANNSKDEIQEVLNNCSVHVLQFHGDETPEFCNQWNRPYWKAIPMANNIDPVEYASRYRQAQAYLIDNFGTKKQGGSGSRFDWNKLPEAVDNKWILAGGLDAFNIQEAKDSTDIRCFDISSGIEKSPGIKSKTKMKLFLNNLNSVCPSSK